MNSCRDLSKGRYRPSSSFSDDGKEKYLDNACSHAQSVTPSSVDNSDTGTQSPVSCYMQVYSSVYL